jgi:hypothetical protein
LVNFTAASERITSDDVITRLVRETPDKENDLLKDERLKPIFAA